jgi:predicted RecA/RadA family phage recombinase
MLLISLFAAIGLCLALCAAGDRSNFSGDVSVTTPTAGYTRGKVYQLNSGAWAMARETKTAGQACLMAVLNDQPCEVTKVTGTGKSFSIGSKVYLTTNQATPSATGNTLVGVAVEAAATTDTTVKVVNCGVAPTLT